MVISFACIHRPYISLSCSVMTIEQLNNLLQGRCCVTFGDAQAKNLQRVPLALCRCFTESPCREGHLLSGLLEDSVGACYQMTSLVAALSGRRTTYQCQLACTLTHMYIHSCMKVDQEAS